MLFRSRWKVSLAFKEPVSSLGGLAFVVDGQDFKDLEITQGGRNVELVKPWQYANLPVADCFSVDTQLYNTSLAFDASTTWFDLFAQHNRRMFVVDVWQSEQTKQFTDQVSLIFEFKGIDSDFVFDKSKLLLNTTMLVNVAQRSARLSPDAPIAYISGGEQLLHLLRPSADQMYGNETPFVVRRAATQRFNVNGLLRLLHCMLDKYSTDYYAFMQVDKMRGVLDGARLYQWLSSLTRYVESTPGAFSSSVYLILKKAEGREDEAIHVKFLTTQGASVNALLDAKVGVRVPAGLSASATTITGDFVPGCDEVQGADAQNSLARYFLITGNRLVTPADLKVFCYNELLQRYNIASSQIRNISVRNQISADKWTSGFETEVTITLVNDIFIQRSFTEKICQAEMILEKMIGVRSASMYPIRVSIELERK